MIPVVVPVVGASVTVKLRLESIAVVVALHLLVEFIWIVSFPLLFLSDAILIDIGGVCSFVELLKSSVLKQASQESSNHSLVLWMALDFFRSVVLKIDWLSGASSLVFGLGPVPPVV